LKSIWIGEETFGELKCGYDYTIYLIKFDSIVDILNINTECGQVCMNNKTFNFSGNPLKNIKTDGSVYEKWFDYTLLDSARKALKRLKSIKGYHFPERGRNEWYIYDGFFGLKKSYNNENKKVICDEALKMIDKKNQNNLTHVELKEAGSGYFFFKIYCSYDYYLNYQEKEKTEWNSFIKENKFYIYVISDNKALLKEQ
jgi:hypothetical protein